MCRFIKPCETRWLSESAALERVHEQLKGLLVYSHDVVEAERLPDCVYLTQALCSLEVVLAMPLVCLLLRELNVLVKKLQCADVLFTQVAEHVEVTITQLTKHFVSASTRFTDRRYFVEYQSLINQDSDLTWVDGDLVYRVPCGPDQPKQDFELTHEQQSARQGRVTTGNVKNKQQLAAVVKTVQACLTQLASNAIAALKSRFPPSNVLQALSIIQPAYYRDEKLSRKDYDIGVSNLCDLYGSDRSTGADQLHAAIINSDLLTFESSFFWDYMTAAKFDGLTAEMLWCRVDKDPALAARMSQFQIIAHIVLSLPASSVECERAFSLMSLVKDARRNRLLDAHLNACMRFGRSRFNLSSFPYDSAYQLWGPDGRYFV